MTQDQPLHERLVAALQARLDVARAQHEDPQHWPPEIWFDPEHGIVTVEVNGAKRYRSWLVTDHGELRATWEWQPPKDAVQLLDPATEIRRVEALLRVVERHAPTEEINVEWFDSPVTGKARCCPSCRPDPDEVTHWNPPIGQAGVEPEGFVRSYVVSPCPTLAALATGEGIEP